MGEQLYGDASVALRELYQNALDALRYRQARHDFLRENGRIHPADQLWKGQIKITQTRDGAKTVITCSDNGVGMGLEELTGAFARAGRRFRDLPAFAEEEAEWLSCSNPIRVYPNSQFGVGVLSYFMLADEVRVRTTRFNRDGSLGPELHVTISGAGALFHVREERSHGKEAGTQIDLVLSPQRFQQKAPSVVDTLRYWLVVADFDTSAEEGSRSVQWAAGVPFGFKRAIPIPNSEPPCWWVPDTGHVLADGLRIEQLERDDGASSDAKLYGALVNLTGRFRPKLSVDRRRMLGWRPEVTDTPFITGTFILASATFLSVDWLESFATDWG
ncbi:hypothetical protein [Nannocystis pusilla]|uniref:hypothetical protein n=1 Tax=Nannocystis pusilla TaxID=889268 RepID=UPI003B7E673C